MSRRHSPKATQGWGPLTPKKQITLRTVLTVAMRIMRQSAASAFPYWYIDMHCGSGWNDFARCAGSPCSFLDAVKETDEGHFYAYFCDKDPSHIDALRVRLARDYAWANGHWHPHLGDNAGVLDVVSRRIQAQEPKPHLAMGCVFFDPNSWTKDAPLDAMSAFLVRHPRIDIILNINAHHHRMSIGAAEKLPNRTMYPSFDEIMERLGKTTWLSRHDRPGHGSDFRMLIGTNQPHAGKFKSLGFSTVGEAAPATSQLELVWGRMALSKG